MMHRRLHSFSTLCALLVALISWCGQRTAADEFAVQPGGGGKLVYRSDDRGNRIPDFSTCGYAGGDRDIPAVPVRIVVKPGAGDDGARIQAALDEVAALPLNADGLRGAVGLAPGDYEIAGQLRPCIEKSATNKLFWSSFHVQT